MFQLQNGSLTQFVIFIHVVYKFNFRSVCPVSVCIQIAYFKINKVFYYLYAKSALRITEFLDKRDIGIFFRK